MDEEQSRRGGKCAEVKESGRGDSAVFFVHAVPVFYTISLKIAIFAMNTLKHENEKCQVQCTFSNTQRNAVKRAERFVHFPSSPPPTVYKKDAPRKTQVFLRFSRFISVFLAFSKIGF